MRISAAWRSLEWPGTEHVIYTEDDTWHADSLAVIVLPEGPVRVSYQVTGGLGGATTRMVVSVSGSVSKRVAIAGDGDGGWRDDGDRALPELDGCLDVDISSTPFTNTLPIHRLDLSPGEGEDLLAVYVKMPHLELSTMRQRYTCLLRESDHSVYRYESPGFRADLTVDDHGLVISYPDLWERL